MQYNSDSKLLQTPQVKSTIPNVTTLTQMPATSSGVPRPLIPLTNWIQMWVFSLTPRLNSSWKWLRKLRKAPYLWLKFYYKGHKSKPAKRRDVTGWDLGRSQKQSFCVLCPWNQGVSTSWHSSVFTSRESRLSLSVLSFYWGFIMCIWLIFNVNKFILQLNGIYNDCIIEQNLIWISWILSIMTDRMNHWSLDWT